MQFQQLMYFVTIAEQKSFNKAAEKLFTTQPNLSKAIRNLEKQINVCVFERTNKGVVLTDDGKKLYRYARTILDQMELIEGLSSSENIRMLSVSSYPIITMGRVISEFYNLHQKDAIMIKVVEERLQKVLESVESGDAEIGFIMNNEVQKKELRNMLNFKGLEFHEVGRDTWYVNLGPKHPLYHRSMIKIEELLSYPFVRLPDDYFSNLTHYLEIAGVRLENFKRKIYLDDSATIISLLQETDAIRFGPGLSKTDFEKYGIRTIPIENCEIEITVGWVKRKRDNLSTEAQEFAMQIEQLYPLVM